MTSLGINEKVIFRLNYLNKERMKRANTNIKKIYKNIHHIIRECWRRKTTTLNCLYMPGVGQTFDTYNNDHDISCRFNDISPDHSLQTHLFLL